MAGTLICVSEILVQLSVRTFLVTPIHVMSNFLGSKTFVNFLYQLEFCEASAASCFQSELM